MDHGHPQTSSLYPTLFPYQNDSTMAPSNDKQKATEPTLLDFFKRAKQGSKKTTIADEAEDELDYWREKQGKDARESEEVGSHDVWRTPSAWRPHRLPPILTAAASSFALLPAPRTISFRYSSRSSLASPSFLPPAGDLTRTRHSSKESYEEQAHWNVNDSDDERVPEIVEGDVTDDEEEDGAEGSKEANDVSYEHRIRAHITHSLTLPFH